MIVSVSEHKTVQHPFTSIKNKVLAGGTVKRKMRSFPAKQTRHKLLSQTVWESVALTVGRGRSTKSRVYSFKYSAVSVTNISSGVQIWSSTGNLKNIFSKLIYFG